MMLRLYAGFLAAILLLPSLGCSTMHQQTIPQEAFSPPMHGPLPRELAKVTMPEYVIEPPDILVIEATQVIPKPPYRLRTGDQIQIQIDGVLPHAPVNNVFLLMPGGVVDLRASAAELAGGMSYGSLSLAGMTVDEAREAIVEFLKKDWREPVVAAADHRRTSGPAGRVDQSGHVRVGSRGGTDFESGQGGGRGSVGRLPGDPRGRGRHLLVQQQGLLCCDGGRWIRRPSGSSAHYGQRDGAGRDVPGEQPVGNFFASDVDRAAHPVFGPSPDSDGRLASDHKTGRYLDELPIAARRPAVHRRRPDGGDGHRDRQIHLAVRTRDGLQLAGRQYGVAVYREGAAESGKFRRRRLFPLDT
jgi:hypothetical protein